MKERNLNIAVFGSSVALTIRPFRTSRQEGNYCDYIIKNLEESGHRVTLNNFASRSRIIVRENILDYVSNLQRSNPDFTILHYGVNEAVPRVWPYKIWLLFHKPKWNRSKMHGKLYPYLLRFETFLISLFRINGWVSKRKFRILLKQMVDTTIKETLSKVILISISNPNEHYIRTLPGVEKLIKDFNHIIAAIALESNSCLIDVNELSENEKVNLCPDGAHLSVLGHTLVGREICNYIHKQYEK
jgi:hypothetical protein